MFLGAAGPVRAANSAESGSSGAAHNSWGHGRIHLTSELRRNLLEGLKGIGASEGHPCGVSMVGIGRCQYSVEYLDHHCSGEREIRPLWGSGQPESEGHCC